MNGEEDIVDVIEDTEEIQKRTESMDKKLWFLIALWVLDKAIMAFIIWLL